MIVAFIKDLLLGIIFVLLLLGVCVTVDYADDTITANETSLKAPSGAVLSNNSSIVAVNDSASRLVGKHSDTIHMVKQKYPTISMWAKPSVRSGYAYRWYYKTFIDYCPHCHHYNVLLKNPKGVPEREYTCRRCGADYCAVTGKEKYSWSRVYLRKMVK